MNYKIHRRLIEANKQAAPESFEILKEKVIVDAIRNGDKSLGIPKRTENEELALLRKAVKLLYDLISVLHQGEINNEEFIKYYNDVENLVTSTKIILHK